MAKTVFSNGSDLLPAFVNSIFGSGAGGGHKHDGVDSDGHCPKVNLFTEITQMTGITTLACKIHTSDMTVEQSFDITWMKVGRLVLLRFPPVQGTSNSTGLTVYPASGSYLPSEIQPSGDANLPCICKDNGIIVPAIMVVSSLILISAITAASAGVKPNFGSNPDSVSQGFTNSGTKAIQSQSVCYMSAS